MTFDCSHNPAGEIVSMTRSNHAYAYVSANGNVADTVNRLNQVTRTGSTRRARTPRVAFGPCGGGRAHHLGSI